MRSGRGIRYRRSIWGSSGGEENRGSKVSRWDDVLIGWMTRLNPQSGTRLAPASFFLFLQFGESKDRKRTGLKSGRYKFKKRPVETKLFLSGVG